MTGSPYLGTPAVAGLVFGAIAPRAAMARALAHRWGEASRLALVVTAVVATSTADPSVRGVVSELAGSVSEEGLGFALLLAAAGILLVGVGLPAIYWLTALLAVVGMGSVTAIRFRQARAAVAGAVWFACLPTVAATLLAAAILPFTMLMAERFNVLVALATLIAVPYLTATIAATFAVGPGRALGASALANGVVYCLVEGFGAAMDAVPRA